MPSLVYQWRKAFLLYMEVNWSNTRSKGSWIAVEFAIKVPDIFIPLNKFDILLIKDNIYFETRLGGMSQTAVLILLGIHWTKKEEFLSCIPAICSSTSFMEILPLNTAATVLVKDKS